MLYANASLPLAIPPQIFDRFQHCFGGALTVKRGRPHLRPLPLYGSVMQLKTFIPQMPELQCEAAIVTDRRRAVVQLSKQKRPRRVSAGAVIR